VWNNKGPSSLQLTFTKHWNKATKPDFDPGQCASCAAIANKVATCTSEKCMLCNYPASIDLDVCLQHAIDLLGLLVVNGSQPVWPMCARVPHQFITNDVLAYICTYLHPS
jgi:hypothetical protein